VGPDVPTAWRTRRSGRALCGRRRAQGMLSRRP
jgi:hypothetical protein